MTLIIEVVGIIILSLCLVCIRRYRNRSDDVLLSDTFSDADWCLRKVREQECFYGGSWQAGNSGRWE